MQSMSSLYSQNFHFSPAKAVSPHVRTNPDVDSQYLTGLLAEHQKLGPFMQVLPICNRLLNQEILRVSGMIPDQGLSDYDTLQRSSPSPMASVDVVPAMEAKNFGGWTGNSWSGLHNEILGGPQGMTMDWQSAPGRPSSYMVKKVLRLEIPFDSYPNDEFQDFCKRQQLSEVAMLNSNFREEIPWPRGSVSPFGSSGTKHAKTDW